MSCKGGLGRCLYLCSEYAVIDLLALLPVISLFIPDAQIG